jgi:hypothetical protein
MGKFQNMDIVFKRAFKISKAINELMGKEPLNNCPILEDKDTEPEVTDDLSNMFFPVSSILRTLNQLFYAVQQIQQCTYWICTQIKSTWKSSLTHFKYLLATLKFHVI